MESPLINKSLDFATQIVIFYEASSKSKKDTTIAKQLLRSSTSVGANLNEAIYGNSKPDFISKLHISLKEISESIYWLTLLKFFVLQNAPVNLFCRKINILQFCQIILFIFRKLI